MQITDRIPYDDKSYIAVGPTAKQGQHVVQTACFIRRIRLDCFRWPKAFVPQQSYHKSRVLRYRGKHATTKVQNENI